MPEQLIAIAEALRAQALALAPASVRAQLEALPPEAILGGVGIVALVLLWIVFSALGAAFGGGRRRREQEVAEELQARRDELRRPAPAPAPAADRRVDERRRDDRRAPVAPPPSPARPSPAPATGGGDLARSHEELMTRGDRQIASGDMNGALASFKEALDMARQLAFARPDAPEPQRMVAKALHKVGDVSARVGDGHAARQAHEQALVLLRRVNAANPRDVSVARELAVTLERLGAAAAQSGDRVGARGAFEEELRIAGAMAQQEQGDLGWTRFKAVVHIMLGNLNEGDSRAHYEQARQLFETLERAGAIQDSDAQTLTQLRGVLSA
jgi:tetratricopeptide (TPR) repeat protein